MNLPAMGPGRSSPIFGLHQLNKCWRRRAPLSDPGYGGICGQPTVSDVGLCDNHLEELKELG